MKWIENIQIAINGLFANKMRSFLTMLGIIIGIGSVIGIVTVGNTLTSTVMDSMGSFGANTVQISIYSREDSNNQVTSNDLITDEMLDQIEERYGNDIGAISLQESAGNGKAQDGRRYANVTLTGVNPGFQTVQDIKLLKGRFVDDSDLQGQKTVAVVSDKLVAKMFGSNVDPLGQEIQVYLNNSIQSFTIVGVYQYEESAMTMMTVTNEDDLRTSLYFPITAVPKVTGKSLDGYQSLSISAKSGVDTRVLAIGLNSMMEKFYEKNLIYSAQAVSFDAILDQVNSIMSTLSIAISVIAGISLVVGGIGVMNIMLVSVTERTREIGTRKALGAQDNDIRSQFITESLILCLIGGAIGIIIGLVFGYFGSILIGGTSPAVDSVTVDFSIPAIVLAVGFSMFIGVFFGYYPANKAAKMDPIEALRYE